MVSHFQIFNLDTVINALVKDTIPFAIGHCQVGIHLQRAIEIAISAREIPFLLVGQATQVVGAGIVFGFNRMARLKSLIAF